MTVQKPFAVFFVLEQRLKAYVRPFVGVFLQVFLKHLVGDVFATGGKRRSQRNVVQGVLWAEPGDSQRLVETAPQGGKERQRPSQIDDVAGDRPALGKPR
jgi:hypothetical protein